MAFDLPGFDHVCVCSEGVDGAHKEEGHGEEGESVGTEDYEEHSEGCSRGSQVGWESAFGDDVGETREEEGAEDYDGDDGIEEEADKVRECSVRDAIVSPWAMMIHFRDATFTSFTMMSPRRLHCITLLTPPHILFLNLFTLALPNDLPKILLLNPINHHPINPTLLPGINMTSPKITPHHRPRTHIKNHHLLPTQGARLQVMKQYLRSICQK